MKENVYVIGEKELFLKNDLEKLKKNLNLTFLKSKTFQNELKSCGGGILVIDPDYIDWNFPNEVLREIKNLKSVCLATTTDSYIDVEYLKRKNIPVYTISNYATQSVAEYLVMLMNCVAKKNSTST